MYLANETRVSLVINLTSCSDALELCTAHLPRRSKLAKGRPLAIRADGSSTVADKPPLGNAAWAARKVRSHFRYPSDSDI